MRPIKFRAYHKPSKKICEVIYVDYEAENYTLRDPNNRREEYLAANNNIHMMQFTGLLDKNGKEIYEGDLLKDNYGEIGEVVWDAKTARFMLFNGGDCWYDYWYIETWAKDKEYEIIGNIHEHKHLLEQC